MNDEEIIEKVLKELESQDVNKEDFSKRYPKLALHLLDELKKDRIKAIQKALSLKEQEQKQKIEKLKSRLCRMNSCNPCGKCFPCLQIDEIFSEDDLK